MRMLNLPGGQRVSFELTDAMITIITIYQEGIGNYGVARFRPLNMFNVYRG